MALNIYLRASDYQILVRDRFLEASDLMYIPVADSFGDLGIGDGDPDKPGAIAAYMDGGACKLAIYNGDGTWSPVSAGNTYTPDPSLPQNPPLSYLNSTYPDAKPGDVVYYEGVNNIDTATCYAPGKWMYSTQYRAK